MNSAAPPKQSNEATFPRAVLDRLNGCVGAVWLILRSLGEDFLTITHAVFVNKIAGSVLLPRVVRYVIYRAFGMKFRTPNIFYGARFTGNRVSLGRNTFVNTDVQFEDVAPITIGDDCQIGMEVLFVTSHHDYRDPDSKRAVISLPITVGDHCWVGARAVILPGVEIEEHCVIAAGAVVTKRCEAYGVYAGIPARRIGEVDRHEIISTDAIGESPAPLIAGPSADVSSSGESLTA
jgi:maltose O-acetyltransferase